MKKYLFIPSIILLGFISCTEKVKDNKLKDGQWRGEFLVAEDQKAPFVFDVTNAETDSATVTLVNGAERVHLTGIKYSGDTVIIPIEAFDAQLVGVIKDGKLTGALKKIEKPDDPGILFDAVWGNVLRFDPVSITTTNSPIGKWDVQFVNEKGDTTNNVGIFELKNNILTGSILTNTGDLRYLEGNLTSDGFQLSAFSGSSPRLLTAVFEGTNDFVGKLYTVRGVTKLIGKRNPNAALADPFSLTQLKKGYNSLSFTFPNSKGKQISLSDPQYKGKVVIVSILGSWCPNCLDELEFLVPWYNENKDRGVEIVGLAFEYKDSPEAVNATLDRLIKRYNIPYEVLYAGKPGDESTAKALPALDRVKSYPTTIFIDKKGVVRKIHTGFSGPATGLFYDDFKTEFNHLIDELLAE
ncbi:MAG: TlpA disulfide reductase family protein [Dysgonomonas sp.]